MNTRARSEPPGRLRRRWLGAALLGGALLAAGCAAPRAPLATLPLQRAWVDDALVEYVTTDVSDAAMAREMGANFVPRLADALPAPAGRAAPGTSLLERAYVFPAGEQIGVFQSAPLPAGAANADRAYSPLWRVVMVHWLKPGARRELRSQEAILDAQDRGELRLTLSDVVVNCPVVRAGDGSALRGMPGAHGC